MSGHSALLNMAVNNNTVPGSTATTFMIHGVYDRQGMEKQAW